MGQHHTVFKSTLTTEKQCVFDVEIWTFWRNYKYPLISATIFLCLLTAFLFTSSSLYPSVPAAPKIKRETSGNFSDSINVTWEKPENPNGVLTGYIIYWEKMKKGILTISGKITLHDGRRNHYLITNLGKFSHNRKYA